MCHKKIGTPLPKSADIKNMVQDILFCIDKQGPLPW
jgi:hypothetical protein